VDIIAGEFHGVKGPASTFTPVNLFNVRLNKNGEAAFSFPENFTTFCVVIEGKVEINSTEIPTNHLALLSNEGTDFTIKASENAVVLLASGAPLKEPISAYGPFVMNTNDELVQAIDDFNNGKFGYLED